jgi:biopolymer transport protein ExbB/TolQ
LIRTFLHWAQLGSEWILWLLLALGAAAALLVIERGYLFASTRLNVLRLGRQLLAFLREDQVEQARALVQSGRALEERVMADALCLYREGSDAVRELVEASLIRERRRYERTLGYLQQVGVHAPFLGLLGTLIGTIMRLADLGREPGDHLALLGSGLAAALITSAVGLLVGIPCLACSAWLRELAEQRAHNAQFLSRILMTELKRNEARERSSVPYFGSREFHIDELDDGYEIELPEPLPAGPE